jgi:hypothetical protein
VIAGALIAACVVSVAVDLWLTYPHYQLNGYQWLGERYILGLSTASYRSVVQITADGVEQTLAWVAQHATPDDTVKTYIAPDHIVRAVSPHPAFTMVDGLRPPSPSVGDADYVITTLHGDIRRHSPEGLLGGGSIFHYPYDRAALLRDFDAVFRVRRPFGLEVATVWRKKTRKRMA